MDTTNMRNRVARWYSSSKLDKKQLGDKLKMLDELLGSWSDDLEGLIKRMEKTYGPEPPRPTVQYRKRIKAFLARHDVEQLKTLETDLVTNKGKEEEWYLMLKINNQQSPTLTYNGEMPPATESTAPRARSVSSVSSATSIASAGSSLLRNSRWHPGDRVSTRLPPVTGPERRGEVIGINSNHSCNVRWTDGNTTHGIDSALLEPTDAMSHPKLTADDERDVMMKELELREKLLKADEHRLAQRESDLKAWARHWGVTDAEEVEEVQEDTYDKTHEYRERLRRFYQKYNPSQLIMVDDMLGAAKGNEEDMFAALVNLYGPEPKLQLEHGEREQVNLTFVQRLKRFYYYHNPSHNQDLDALAVRYRHRQEQLMIALVSKYGPEPVGGANVVQHRRQPSRAMHMLSKEALRLRRCHQRQVLRSMLSGISNGLLHCYYFRWMELMWAAKNTKLLHNVVGECRSSMLKERFTKQQLQSQIEMLQEELSRKEAEVESESLPAGDRESEFSPQWQPSYSDEPPMQYAPLYPPSSSSGSSFY
eukprot:TRINITY_DN36849_c0_g1_i1.p1 TRINITY_DN36849_c0_g1~~TRINITY_DN36849_c0_g1_i1.p1  ORF type:complete len:535 (+),score=100.75 TRINITY_DN36849_c0_g1_i1:34-1638(+)